MHDYVTPGPIGDLTAPALPASVPLPVAAGVMRQQRLECVVVLDRGEICGVLTQLDLLRAASVEGAEPADLNVADVCCRQVRDLMAGNPFLVSESTSVAQAAQLMLAAEVASAVTMRGQDVTGVLTAGDLTAGEQLTAGVPATAGQVAGQCTVGDLAVKVKPLSVDDGLPRVIELVAAAHGRPVPVLEGDWPVGSVHIPMTRPAAPTGPAATTAVMPPAARMIDRRRGSGTRFYTRAGASARA